MIFVKWCARIIGVVLFGMVLALFIGEAVTEGLPNPLNYPPGVQAEFGGILLIVLGLILGWFWPRIASVMILSGLVVFHTVEGKFWINGFFGLIGLAGVLYFVSGNLQMKAKQKTSKRLAAVLAGILIILLACAAGYSAKRFTPAKIIGLQFVNQPVSAKGIVVVTHGWIEKGSNDWPEDMAKAISQKTDSNDWLCGYFDWSKGAAAINPADAAKYAKDFAGVALAGQILLLDKQFEHIHLIGHSSGCWVISQAAKILAAQTSADIHLTFLDAFVPSGWQPQSLGDVNMPADSIFWADHYFTRDLTLGWTEHNLENAHNVDVTEIDQFLKDHKFPWKWYYATITGSFPKGSFLDDKKLVTQADGIQYGFSRSREFGGEKIWNENRLLKHSNDAVKLKKAD